MLLSVACYRRGFPPEGTFRGIRGNRTDLSPPPAPFFFLLPSIGPAYALLGSRDFSNFYWKTINPGARSKKVYVGPGIDSVRGHIANEREEAWPRPAKLHGGELLLNETLSLRSVNESFVLQRREERGIFLFTPACLKVPCSPTLFASVCAGHGRTCSHNSFSRNNLPAALCSLFLSLSLSLSLLFSTSYNSV